MAHQFTIEGDAASAVAPRPAPLAGNSLIDAVADTRGPADVERMLPAAAGFHALLDDPALTSNHGWLHDHQTGLPV